MSIQIETCWSLLKRHYERSAGREAEKNQMLAHAERVVKLCRELTASLEPRLRECMDENLLDAAAVLHDIAKFDPEGRHEETAMDAVLQECREQNVSLIDSAYFFALGEIIRAHTGEFDPHPKVFLEAAVLKMAGKLDKVICTGGAGSAGGEEAEKSYEKALQRIEDFCQRSYKAVEHACRDVRFEELYP